MAHHSLPEVSQASTSGWQVDIQAWNNASRKDSCPRPLHTRLEAQLATPLMLGDVFSKRRVVTVVTVIRNGDAVGVDLPVPKTWHEFLAQALHPSIVCTHAWAKAAPLTHR